MSLHACVLSHTIPSLVPILPGLLSVIHTICEVSISGLDHVWTLMMHCVEIIRGGIQDLARKA